MRLIDADIVVHWESYDDEHESFTRHSGTIAEFLDQMTDEGCPETVDAVPVRCKDCKHRPTGTNRDDLEFPADKCPCKCEDYWYSWKPLDNWFCGNGELDEREGDHHD